MCPRNGKKLFIVLYVITNIAAIALVGGGGNFTTIASIPIIMSATAMVFGMLYASAFHGSEHVEERQKAPPRARMQPAADNSRAEALKSN